MFWALYVLRYVSLEVICFCYALRYVRFEVYMFLCFYALRFVCGLPWTALVAISLGWLDVALIKSCRHFLTFLSNFSQSQFQKPPKFLFFFQFFSSGTKIHRNVHNWTRLTFCCQYVYFTLQLSKRIQNLAQASVTWWINRIAPSLIFLPAM